MPFDPQGNFTRVMNWQDDAANSIPIVASRHDDEDDNFAQGLSNTLCRDGRAAMTGNLKMGSFKITSLGNGTTDNDAVNKGQLDSAVASVSASISTIINNTLKSLYPVGSVYIGTQSTCPMASLISGSTWTLVSSGKALWTGNGSNANTTIDAGLPNITGTVASSWSNDTNTTGAFKNKGKDTSENWGGDSGWHNGRWSDFDASRSSSIYGNSTTVQPPAYVVNVWRRTA